MAPPSTACSPSSGGTSHECRSGNAAQATFCATLVDEWVRAGVRHAVVCPGSRSAPLALALADRPELSVHVRLDERGAGFFAVGVGRATGRPAVVCVTSGTAAAELHAAVVEAHHGRVPLVVCTADRPPELHGVGAPQTIDQAGLYGGAVRWFADPGVPQAEQAPSWRSLGARAVAEATLGPSGPGPVHLNLAFREPLVGEPGPVPPGRGGGEPFHDVRAPRHAVRDGALHEGWAGRRGVLLAGEGCGPPELVLAAAERLGWPVLADPRSGCRRRHPHVVGAADALARAGDRALAPEVVVRLGAAWASKALASLLEGAEVAAVDPWWRWEDPDRSVSALYRCDAAAWLEAALDASAPGAPPGWLASWQAAEAAAQAAIDAAIRHRAGAGDGPGSGDGVSEPAVARHLFSMVPHGTTVVVSSSMPVRDLEWFAPATDDPPRVLANRGVNGIDGVCSTALGAAAATTGPVVGLVGDLAFLHDVSALVGAGGPPGLSGVSGPAGSTCVLVVLDNGGGGIFDFLPQARAFPRERFEQLFGTPQAPDVARVASGFGLETADVGTLHELQGALGAALRNEGLRVIRVRVPDRRANVVLHDRIHDAVAAALAARR